MGFIPVPIEHFGGLVTSWPPEMIDADLATEATNVRFTQAEVASREGLTLTLRSPNLAPVIGVAAWQQSDVLEEPYVTPRLLICDQTLGLFYESAPGNGVLVPVPWAENSTTRPAQAAQMNATATYGRAYLAFSDGQFGTGAAHWDGQYLDPITTPAPTGSSTAADSTLAGNVAAGLRFGIVMFQSRDGSLSAPQFPFSWTAAGSQEVTVSNLPIGPAQVVARVVAFTVAGGTSTGPYYYIEEPQTVNGVNETSTVVEDNVSTTATFNFDDAFLASSLDATNQFRAIQVTTEGGVLYSTLTDRLMWWGEPASPSVVRCSEAADAGLYLGDTGFIEISPNDGTRITAVYEWRDAIYVAKEHSLYRVTPNDGDPATWQVTQVSYRVGACGARAVALGEDFVFKVHRSGAYLFAGGQLQLVSDELLGASPDRPGLWERINWAAADTIWAHVDVENKVARIGVPLDSAVTPSHILKASYLDGWDPSLRFSAFTARYHFFPGRRWSLDTISATQAATVERPAAATPLFADRRETVRQILLPSAASDGAVNRVDPQATADNGQPILSVYQTGALSATEHAQQIRAGVQLMGAVQVRARGAGALEVASVAGGGAPRPFLRLALTDAVAGDITGFARAAGEGLSLRVTGVGPWRLLALYAYMQPWLALRPGGRPGRGPS